MAIPGSGEAATLTEAILTAIRRELARRRELIDSDTRLAQVTITVKLIPGTVGIRGTSWDELRVGTAADGKDRT